MTYSNHFKFAVGLILIIGSMLIVEAVQPTSIPFRITTNDTSASDLTITAYNSSSCTGIRANITLTNKFENGEAFVVIGENSTTRIEMDFNNHTFFEFFADNQLLNFTNATEIRAGTGDTTCLAIRAGQGQVGNNAIDNTTVQSRVTGTCDAGTSIRVIDVNGEVTCETDDSGAFTTNASVDLLINKTVTDIGNLTWVTTGNLTAFREFWYNFSLVEGLAANPFDQDLNTTDSVKFQGLNVTNASQTLGLFIGVDANLGIGTYDLLHKVNIQGSMDLVHTAVDGDDHGLDVHFDADGFGDAKGILVGYDTGALGLGDDASAILISIDQAFTTGGDIHGILVTSTGAVEM